MGYVYVDDATFDPKPHLPGFQFVVDPHTSFAVPPAAAAAAATSSAPPPERAQEEDGPDQAAIQLSWWGK